MTTTLSSGGSITGTSIIATTQFNGSGAGLTNLPSSSLTGTVPISNGGTGQTSAASAFNALNPMTTTGDMIYESSTGVSSRLAIGSSGTILSSNGSSPSWNTLTTDGTTITGNGTSTPLSVISTNTTVGLSVRYNTITFTSGTNTIFTNAGGFLTPFPVQKEPANWVPSTGIYTVSVTGWYRLTGHILWANPGGTATGARQILILLNGTTSGNAIIFSSATPVANFTCATDAIQDVFLTSGNTIAFMGFQSQGANLTGTANLSITFISY